MHLQLHENHSVGPPGFVTKYFSLDGAGVTIPMNVNGTTPKNFDLIVPAGETWLISRISILLEDGTTEPADFMGLGGKLTNGITIQALAEDGTVSKDFTNGLPFKSHEQFGLLGGITVQTTPGTSKDDVVKIVWLFFDEGGPMRLTDGEGIRFIIADNISTVSDMRAMAHGHQLD